jgi:hypothetical protein
VSTGLSCWPHDFSPKNAILIVPRAFQLPNGGKFAMLSMTPKYRRIISRGFAYKIGAHSTRSPRRTEIFFDKETLAIRILWVVSGAAMIGVLVHADTLIDLAGMFSILLFLSTMCLSFAAAAFSAHWKRKYKIRDTKAAAAEYEQDWLSGFKPLSRHIRPMRIGIWTSSLLILLGFIQLIILLWVSSLGG